MKYEPGKVLSKDQCYSALSAVSDSWRAKLLLWAEAQDEWKPYPSIYHINVPVNKIQEEPLFEHLYSRFNCLAKLFKFPPNTYYPFHSDSRRRCVVNMVLNRDNPGITLFQTSKMEHNQFRVISLDYERNVPYLFNTQVRHNVINISRDARYLLTVALGYPEPFLYSDVRAELISEASSPAP
jgi:hypothetical protein